MAKQIQVPALNDAQITIGNFLAKGKTQKDIAKMFSTTQPTISKIFKGTLKKGPVYEMLASFKNVKAVVIRSIDEIYREDEQKLVLIVTGVIVFILVVVTLFTLISLI